eukprot:6194256-Pleurochrysis_carterae.AAC.2
MLGYGAAAGSHDPRASLNPFVVGAAPPTHLDTSLSLSALRKSAMALLPRVYGYDPFRTTLDKAHGCVCTHMRVSFAANGPRP